MMATGGHFLGRGSTLAIRDREIVIDRTCARCGNEYEWGVHVAAFAEAAGLSAPRCGTPSAIRPTPTRGPRRKAR